MSEPPRSEGVARSTGFALAAQLTTAAFTAVLTLYLVRALGPSGYGTFSLAVSIGTLLLLPADFGISTSTARYVAENVGERNRIATLLADALQLKVVISAVICGALFALAGPIADAYGEPLTWPIRAIAVALFGQSMMQLLGGAFAASRRVALNFRLTFSEAAVECGASIALVVVSGGAAAAAWGRAAGYVTGGVVGLLMGARVFGYHHYLRPHGRPRNRRMIFRYARSLLIIDGAFTLFQQVDILLIGAYLGSTAVGQFQAPLRLLTFLYYPTYAVAIAVSPRLAGRAGDPEAGRSFAGALRLIILVQSVMMAPLIVWPGPIVHLLLGAGYGDSVQTLRVLSVSVYLAGIAPLVSLSVNYLGGAPRRIPLMLAAVAANALIDVILIPRIGIVAGAIGTGVAYLIMVAGHLGICEAILHVPLDPAARSALRGLAAAAIMAGALLIMGMPHSIVLLIGGLIVGTIVYVCALFALRELHFDDLRRLRALVLRGAT